MKEDKIPRLAYREQRNGVRRYYVEVWACYESGCMWSQDSRETTDLEEAWMMLKEKSDKEIVGRGILTNKDNELSSIDNLLDDVKQFIDQALTKVREDTIEECIEVDYLKLEQALKEVREDTIKECINKVEIIRGNCGLMSNSYRLLKEVENDLDKLLT